MSERKHDESLAEARYSLILSKLLELFSRLFGKPAEELAVDATLIELGVDSLFLLQASQVIRSEFGVKVPFRLLLEELSTIEAIATHLDEKLPASFAQNAPPAEAKSAAPANGTAGEPELPGSSPITETLVVAAPVTPPADALGPTPVPRVSP